MMSRRIVYITTNKLWSGSEELWVRSARNFCNKGFSIAYVTKYNHQELSALGGSNHYLFSERFKKKPIIKRVIEKLFRVKLKNYDVINEILKKERPELVILSQGNNIDHDGIMECCFNLKIPYVTITHLVTEFFFLYIDDTNLYTFQQGYLNALRNFFVSKRNLKLNNLMLSTDLPNAEVIYNPCKISEEQVPVFPKANDVYKVGLVGRIECFHKGYDLLLELACKEKWKERSLHFNIYGEGPHTSLLKANTIRLGLKNVTLKGHEKCIDKVWAENHILFMPSRMEGQALTLIEAMFCNRAAIVTDVGGASSLVKEGYSGFIAAFASLQCLDDTLERAWINKQSWKQLGMNAGETIRTNYPNDTVGFFNKKIIKELEKINV